MSAALDALSEINEALLSELDETDAGLFKKWLAKVIIYHPAGLLKPDNLMMVHDHLFLDDEGRIGIFILELTIRFFTLAGDGPEFIERLCQNLSDGLCIDAPYPSYSLLPKEWLSTTPSAVFNRGRWPKWIRVVCRWLGIESLSVSDFLLSNKHLVVVLLLRMRYANSQ